MVFEKLTEWDKEAIDLYRKFYGNQEKRYGNDDYCDLSMWLRYWDKNKVKLFDMFGGQLILEKEVELEVQKEEMYKNFRQKRGCYGDPIYEFLETYIVEINQRLNLFDELGLWNLVHYILKDSITIVNGTISLDKTISFIYNGKKYSFQDGMKTMRAIKQVIDIFDLKDSAEHYEKFRIAVSQITNQKRTKGTLCISIHPLDYMTMSDNDCDWSSCMSWAECGCYRRGTIEMLNSPMVVVGYLKAHNDMRLLNSDKQWNNKKWRELFVINEGMITGIKGYPFHNEELEATVIHWLRDLAFVNLNYAYTEDIHYYTYGREYYIHEEKTTVSIRYQTYDMYNDFGCTKDAIHPAVFNIEGMRKYSDGIYFTARYSEYSTCVVCGASDVRGNESHICCTSCGYPVCTCDCCGEECDEDAMYEMANGAWVCEYCWDNDTFYCPIADGNYWRDDALRIHISLAPDKLLLPKDYSDEELDRLKKLFNVSSNWDLPTNLEINILDNCWIDNPSRWHSIFTCDHPRVITKKYSGYGGMYTVDEYWVSVHDVKPNMLRPLIQNDFWFESKVFDNMRKAYPVATEDN